jgi:hypothetical protein
MSLNPPSLEQTILKLEAPPPSFMALPPTHLTRSEWFGVIVQKGQLEPHNCKFFNEKLLYFFYGGVFFRPASRFTPDELQFPIAFVFEPSVLTSFSRYYPFDTGAMFKGYFKNWAAKMAPFQENFKLEGKDYTAPSRLVYHLFGSNEEYLRGRPRAELQQQPAPLPLLWEFFRDNLPNPNTDHRQVTIECQTGAAIPLDRNLIWVGYPDSLTSEYLDLLQRLKPYVPRSYRYIAPAKFNPRDIAAELEAQARLDIIDFYLNPPTIPGRA